MNRISRYLNDCYWGCRSRIFHRIRNSPPLAHHGIQRSGTNYLLLSLTRLDVLVLNAIDPDRDNPKHKHFRWYNNNKDIPDVIRDQYENEVKVSTFDALNEAAGYPPETRHLVIIKEETAWLASILNWGLRCGWFSEKKIALSKIDIFRKDYENYYAFWKMLADEKPDRVAVILLSDLQNDLNSLKCKLAQLGIPFTETMKSSFHWGEVPQSPVDRPILVSREEIESMLIHF